MATRVAMNVCHDGCKVTIDAFFHPRWAQRNSPRKLERPAPLCIIWSGRTSTTFSTYVPLQHSARMPSTWWETMVYTWGRRHGGKRSGRSGGVRHPIYGTWPEAVGIIGRAESVALLFVNQWITTDTRFPSKYKGHWGRGPSRLSIRHYCFIIDAEFMFCFSELPSGSSESSIQLSIGLHHKRQTDSTTRGGVEEEDRRRMAHVTGWTVMMIKNKCCSFDTKTEDIHKVVWACLRGPLFFPLNTFFGNMFSSDMWSLCSTVFVCLEAFVQRCR